MLSRTTSRDSTPSIVMPYSVSMPKARFMDNAYLHHHARHGGLRAASNGGDLHHVFGVVVDELQPIFRDIAWRENVVFQVLGFERTAQIRLADPLLEIA